MPISQTLVLTPTARLARRLLARHAIQARAAGAGAWLAPAIQPFSVWLSRLRNDYLLHGDTSADPRVPLDSAQANIVWSSIIDMDVFVGEPRVAELAQSAWRLLHEYDLERPETWQRLHVSQDAAAFASWSEAFLRSCRDNRVVDEWTLNTMLPGAIADGRLELPPRIELAGFDLPLTPLQHNLLDACRGAGCEVRHQPADPSPPPPAQPELRIFHTPDDELQAAASWARGVLQLQPDANIGVVVPDLSGRVDAVERNFRAVFDPAGLRLQPQASQPWHISMGKPLSNWPLVDDALNILNLNRHRIDQPQAAQLFASPYVRGWPEEIHERAQARWDLIRTAPYALTARELLQLTPGAPVLNGVLLDWLEQRAEAPRRATPSQWVGQLQRELTALGFGSGRTLDSQEYQTLQRWHDLLEALCSMDLLFDAPITRSRVLAILRERANGTVFRERDTGAPVEILGVEEAIGARFDALWITTMDNQTWPGTPQRHPLLPAAVQTPVPRSTSDGLLQRSRAELSLLLRGAPEVITSLAEGMEEPRLTATGMLQPCAVVEPPEISQPQTAAMETVAEDMRAPALDVSDPQRGGTGVLRDQSACPFRAFATYRLHAEELRPPRPGLDAGQRGTLVHQVLQQFWKQTRDLATLQALSDSERAERIANATQQTLARLTGRYRLLLSNPAQRLEQQRIQHIVEAWLQQEMQRAPFSVAGLEQRVSMTFEGLQLSGSVDRIDRVENGAALIIDYKTGNPRRSAWAPDPRMSDPQLPAYALSTDPPADAIAFGKVRAEEQVFDGLCAEPTGTDGVITIADDRWAFKDIDDWAGLTAAWQHHINGLARGFIQGEAQVDPREPRTCENCHLHGLCRISERAPDLEEAGGSDRADDDE